jgi:chemotaxis signal transduction protein
MAAVDNYRQRLSALQGSWDTLSLLSHLSGNGTDMSQTRQAFESLSRDLLANLETETLKKTMLALKAGAQISIDIIVRNLYERTADVGFLCADDELRSFVAKAGSADCTEPELARLKKQMLARLREYVAKYSIYHNVIVTDLNGKVLVQLDQDNQVTHSQDPLLQQTLGASGYVETFRQSDLSSEKQSLIFSARICEGYRPIGVLCLCFKFADEVRGIFDKLKDADSWTLFTFLDAEKRVIASNDPWQVPLGMQLDTALDETGKIVRICGREYLAITRKTNGYQGYVGPGWSGHALIPVEHAFDQENVVADNAISDAILGSLRTSQTIFSPELRSIPVQADSIQRELNRSVWNGNVSLAAQGGSKNDFAKVLLSEIGNTGIKTKETFERSISELQQTVVSSILEDTRLLASLAVDILDRNLYERANDCRWWALNTVLSEELDSGQPAAQRITPMLRHINGLYTVYHCIVVFDADQRIVAVSNPALDSMVDSRLEVEWAERALQLRDSQSYCVSRFERSPLYADQHALIYAAAVRGKNGRAVGGVAVVFDSAPQLNAILRDSLPRTESGDIATGCVGVFVDADHQVVAATDRFAIGSQFALSKVVTDVDAKGSARILSIENQHFAVGACKTSGYREYIGLDAAAFILIPLGAESTEKAAHRHERTVQRRSATGEQVVDVATFYCDDQWLGIFREHIVESVDGSDLQPIPGRPAWYAGCLMHRGDPIPVIDLGRLTGRTTPATGKDVVVVQTTNEGQRIGLLVNELADIPEIPVREILPVAEAMFQSQSSVIDRVVRPQQGTSSVLLILSLEQLLIQLRTRDPVTVQVASSTPAKARKGN